jgi:hypothetical protein
VEFGFEPTEKNFEKYIKPWNTSGLNYYAEELPHWLGRIYKVYYCASCRNEIANQKDGCLYISKSHGRDECTLCGAELDKYGYIPYIIGYRIIKHKEVSNADFLFGIFTVLSENDYVTAINSFLS